MDEEDHGMGVFPLGHRNYKPMEIIEFEREVDNILDSDTASTEIGSQDTRSTGRMWPNAYKRVQRLIAEQEKQKKRFLQREFSREQYMAGRDPLHLFNIYSLLNPESQSIGDMPPMGSQQSENTRLTYGDDAIKQLVRNNEARRRDVNHAQINYREAWRRAAEWEASHRIAIMLGARLPPEIEWDVFVAESQYVSAIQAERERFDIDSTGSTS